MTSGDRGASELQYQLLLAHDLDYLSRDAYVALNEQVAEVKGRFTIVLSQSWRMRSGLPPALKPRW
jgi:hypothetical protein